MAVILSLSINFIDSALAGCHEHTYHYAQFKTIAPWQKQGQQGKLICFKIGKQISVGKEERSRDPVS